MAKQKKSTKAVATPKLKTTVHTIIKAVLGHKVGDKVELGIRGVEFYKKQKLIK